MDRNSVIGLVLIGAFLLAWSYFFAPTPTQNNQQNLSKDTLIKTLPKPDTLQNANSEPKDSVLQSIYGIFAPVLKGEEQFITVQTELHTFKFSTKGGIPVQIISKKYKTFDNKPLPLVENYPANQWNYKFLYQNNLMETQQIYFTPSAPTLSLKGNEKKELFFTAQLTENKKLILKYVFYGNSYHFDHELIVEGLGQDIKNNYFELTWRQVIPKTEKSKEKMYPESSVYYLYNDEVDYLESTSAEPQEFKEQGKFKWISFKSQFFSNTLIASKEEFEFMEVKTRPTQNPNTIKDCQALLQIPYRHAPKENFSLRVYSGPNDIKLLQSYDLQLDRQISLGWALFRAVTNWLIIPAFHFFEGFTSNYGIVILLLALFIKLLLTPLTYRSHLSMAKMRIVNNLPEMKAIEEKYKDDATKLQQAKMQFYQKVGVSPLSGCLPMLLQIPILLSMFYFFPSAIELRQQPFLWAADLSTYDSILDLGFSIPFYGDHVSLFTLLMTISTLVYTYIQQKAQGNTGPKELKYMGYIFPIIFLGILNNYSAGLSWYYFIMNMLTIGQTYLMQNMVSEDKIHAAIEETKKKPVKKTRFQRMLEEAQKQQELKSRSKK